ncbi:hypothetical protein MMPV_008928 [Pyropia vietnamensis]
MDEQVVPDFSGPLGQEVPEVPQVAAALPPSSSAPPAASIFSVPSFAAPPVPSAYVFEPLPVAKPTVPVAPAVGSVTAAVKTAAELPRPRPVAVPSSAGSSTTSHDQTVPQFGGERFGYSAAPVDVAALESAAQDMYGALAAAKEAAARDGSAPRAAKKAKVCVSPPARSSDNLHAPVEEGGVPATPRWQTPLRTGDWLEKWAGARQLGVASVDGNRAAGMCASLRSLVAKVVVLNVGGTLPVSTVEKWLCLLAEYLMLNADEHVLAVSLLKKYVQSGKPLVGEGDWARPQRWECVVAIACYLAVLLSEEFPGRTAMDLRELLGPNFRFGSEQMSFLKAVDWKISVAPEDFADARDLMTRTGGDDDKLLAWFGYTVVGSAKAGPTKVGGKRSAEEAGVDAYYTAPKQPGKHLRAPAPEVADVFDTAQMPAVAPVGSADGVVPVSWTY